MSLCSWNAAPRTFCRLPLLSSEARICAAGDFENLPSRASAIVDKHFLARADLPFGGLLAVDLLGDRWAGEEAQRYGKPQGPKMTHLPSPIWGDGSMSDRGKTESHAPEQGL